MNIINWYLEDFCRNRQPKFKVHLLSSIADAIQRLDVAKLEFIVPGCIVLCSPSTPESRRQV